MKEGELQGGLSKHIREDSYLIDQMRAGDGDLIVMVAGNYRETVSHTQTHTQSDTQTHFHRHTDIGSYWTSIGRCIGENLLTRYPIRVKGFHELLLHSITLSLS